MKKLFAALAVLVFQFGIGQQSSEKALLWEITGNNLEKPSYLFGTIHLACQGDVEMRPEIQKAFDSTESLFLEIAMDDPEVMNKMMQASISTDKKTISEKLGKELAEKVNAMLEDKMSIGLTSFDQLRMPMFTTQLSLLTMDCPLALGYDMMLTQEAAKTKKKIVGLESIEKQIDILFSQSDEDAVQMVEYIVLNFNEFKKETENLMVSYKNQDIEELYAISTASLENPKYNFGSKEEFLDQRNQSWIPVIKESIQRKPIFIAVGAAHLAGKNGVIQLLRDQGFKVQAIN